MRFDLVYHLELDVAPLFHFQMNQRRKILTCFFLFMICFAASVDSASPFHGLSSLPVANQSQFYGSSHEDTFGNTETPNKEKTQGQANSISDDKKFSIDDFPHDFMTQYQRQHGGVVVHVLFAFYIFIALVLVYDSYFIPSLELISEKLHLSSDVAGATLMAAGGSVSSLCTSLIGVFISKNEIAFGAVAGSGLFNSLFVVAICGLFADTDLRLKPWPLSRDCFCYFLSIAALIVVIYDEKVYWFEALVLVAMYSMYVVAMYFNTTLETCYGISTGNNSQITDNVEESTDEKTSLLMTNSENSTKLSIVPSRREENEIEKSDQNVNYFYHSSFPVPQEIMTKTWWVVKLPMMCLFSMTIPDCRKIRLEKWYVVTFFLSMTWIGLLTYVLVWMVSIIGFTLGIPNVIMSMTFLAASGSGPDGTSSLLAARQGKGDMAVSNLLGSNVFDISLCLGLPWLVKSSFEGSKDFVAVHKGGMIYVLIILMTTILVVLLLTKMNRWNLNKCLGITFLIFYLVFTASSGFLAYKFGDESL